MARRGIQFAMGLALLGAVVAYVDMDAITEALRHAEASWIALAAILAIPNVLLDAWSWGTVLRPVAAPESSVSHRVLLRSTLAGYAAGFFTPARVGEFAGRALTLPFTDTWTVSLTVVVQRMVDMLVAVAAGLGIMIWSRRAGVLSAVWDPAIGVGAVVVMAFAAGLARPGAIDRWLRHLLPRASGLHERTALLHSLRGTIRTRLLIGCCARYLIYFAQMTFFVRAFTSSAEWANLAAGTGLMYYFKYLIPSLTLLDVGIREGAAVLTYGWMSVPEAAALNGALLIFFINLALPAMAGAPFLLRASGRVFGVTQDGPDAPSRDA